MALSFICICVCVCVCVCVSVCVCVCVCLYYVDEKLMISLFNNSEKLVQILLEFSQQIVEG